MALGSSESDPRDSHSVPDDVLSPTDGYFHALPPQPQDVLIPDPEQHNTPAAKEQEARESEQARARGAARNGAGSSSSINGRPPRRPTSPAASSIVSASSRRSVDSSIEALGGEQSCTAARPQLPSYDDAIAERPYQGPPLLAGGPVTYRTMDSASTLAVRGREMAESSGYFGDSESQPLLRSTNQGDDGRRRRFCGNFQSWRKNSRRVVKKILVVLLILAILAIILSMLFRRFKRSDTEDPLAPEMPHREAEARARAFCPTIRADASFPWDFTDPKTLEFAQTSVDSFDDAYGRSIRQGGEIHLASGTMPLHNGGKYDTAIFANIFFSHNFLSHLVSYNNEGTTVWIQTPKAYRGFVAPNEDLCMYSVITIYVRPGYSLDTIGVDTQLMSISVDDGFSVGEHSDSLQLLSYSGSVRFPSASAGVSNLHSRNIRVETQSGAITGHYPIFDSLQLISTSGHIDVSVEPRAASPRNVKPAILDANTIAGSIKIVQPGLEKLKRNAGKSSVTDTARVRSDTSSVQIPDRDYTVKLETSSGHIEADVLHGSSTRVTTNSGHIEISLAPWGDPSSPTGVETSSKTGGIECDISDSVSHPGSTLKNLSTSIDSTSGRIWMGLAPSWEGNIEGSTVSGGLSFSLPGFHIRKGGRDGQDPIPFYHIAGYVGNGDGLIDMKSISGRLEMTSSRFAPKWQGNIPDQHADDPPIFILPGSDWRLSKEVTTADE